MTTGEDRAGAAEGWAHVSSGAECTPATLRRWAAEAGALGAYREEARLEVAADWLEAVSETADAMEDALDAGDAPDVDGMPERRIDWLARMLETATTTLAEARALMPEPYTKWDHVRGRSPPPPTDAEIAGLIDGAVEGPARDDLLARISSDDEAVEVTGITGAIVGEMEEEEREARHTHRENER